MTQLFCLQRRITFTRLTMQRLFMFRSSQQLLTWKRAMWMTQLFWVQRRITLTQQITQRLLMFRSSQQSLTWKRMMRMTQLFWVQWRITSTQQITQRLLMFRSSQQSLTWKKSDTNDTAVLSTTKNNIDSADNAAKFDKFVKSVHSQRTDKSEDFMNKIYTLLYFSRKWSRFNHSKKDIISITLTNQTLHYSKSLKYVYK